MPIFKRLKFFKKYESLKKKKIINIIKLNTIQKNFIKLKKFFLFNKKLRSEQMLLITKFFFCYTLEQTQVLSGLFTSGFSPLLVWLLGFWAKPWVRFQQKPGLCFSVGLCPEAPSEAPTEAQKPNQSEAQKPNQSEAQKPPGTSYPGTSYLVIKKNFFYLRNFIKNYDDDNYYFLFLKKMHKQIWIIKIKILLLILFKKFLCNVKLLLFVKKFFGGLRFSVGLCPEATGFATEARGVVAKQPAIKFFTNCLKFCTLNFTFFFTNNIVILLLYYFIDFYFDKFHYFQYRIKILKKKEQSFLNFHKSFFYIEVKTFMSFFKFYKKNFVNLFKVNKLLWNNFLFKKEIKGFVFKNSFFNKEKNWLNFIKFKSLIKGCLKLFDITNFNTYLIYKGGYREKNLLFLKKKTYLNFLKKNLNLNKFLLVKSFFLLKNKKIFLFHININHLDFFSTLMKISNFSYILSNLANLKKFKLLDVISNNKSTKTLIKKKSFFYFNFLAFKQKDMLNKILRNKNRKFCFYNLFSKSFFFNISSKNLLTEFNQLFNVQSLFNKPKSKSQCGGLFSQIGFFTSQKNFVTSLNKNFFKVWFYQSNLKKIFYEDCFYFIYKINKKEMFNFKKLNSFLQKKCYKSKNLYFFEINSKLVLVKSLKNFIFISHNLSYFFKPLAELTLFFQNRLEKIILFLLKSYIDLNKFKFSTMTYYKKSFNKKNLYHNQLKTNFTFKGFSIFFINFNLIFEKNKRCLKKKFFLLKTFHKFDFCIRKEFILLPSKKEIIKYLKKLEKRIYRNFSQNQKKFLLKLKNSIMNWCFNYRIINRPEIFIYCDNILKNFLWKWVCNLHRNKRKHWIKKKYFVLLKNKIFPILSNKNFFASDPLGILGMPF